MQKTVISTTTMHIRLLRIRTMQIRVISTRTMAVDGDKHKTLQMKLLSTSKMPNEVVQNKNNAKESAKHKNNGRRR